MREPCTGTTNWVPGLFSAFGFEKRITEPGGIAKRPETVVEFDLVDPVEGDRQSIGELVLADCISSSFGCGRTCCTMAGLL
jgi:hypothetical protein